MKLKALVENTVMRADGDAQAGLSLLLDEGGTQILLDVGASDLFLRNAERMGVDLSGVSILAISHGHYDHTRGISALLQQPWAQGLRVIAHPEAFAEKQLGGVPVGVPVTQQTLEGTCNLTLARTPVWLTERLVWLGEIPRVFDFEIRPAINQVLHNGVPEDDLLPDDTALAYRGDDGVYIITGCSHSGICNITEYAAKVCGAPVVGILGGFHLVGVTPMLEAAMDYFERHNITRLWPCHCTDFYAKAAIHARIPIGNVQVGFEIEWA